MTPGSQEVAQAMLLIGRFVRAAYEPLTESQRVERERPLWEEASAINKDLLLTGSIAFAGQLLRAIKDNQPDFDMAEFFDGFEQTARSDLKQPPPEVSR